MTSNAHPGTRILGSLRSADGKGVVRTEDRVDAGIADVWSALTDPSRLARWYGEDLTAHLAGQERCDAEARFGELLPAYQDLAASNDAGSGEGTA
jgi:hypothetical protein